MSSLVVFLLYIFGYRLTKKLQNVFHNLSAHTSAILLYTIIGYVVVLFKYHYLPVICHPLPHVYTFWFWRLGSHPPNTKHNIHTA